MVIITPILPSIPLWLAAACTEGKPAMSRMKLRLWTVAAWAMLMMGWGAAIEQNAAAAQTQAKASESSQAVAETAPSDAIQISEIPDRLLETAALIRRANSHAEPQGTIRKIEELLPEFGKGVRTLLARNRQLLKGPLAPGATRELKNGWGIIDRRLSGWQTLLKDRSTSLQKYLDDLDSEEGSWKIIQNAAAAQNLPEDLRSEITGTLNEIRGAQRSVLSRRNEILRLQSEISQLSIDIDETVELLSLILGLGRERLLQFDSPPIWNPEPFQQTDSVLEDVRAESTQSAAEVLKYYLLNTLEFMAIGLVAFFVVLVLLLLLRNKAAAYKQSRDESIRGLGFAIRKPFSTAILLTVVVAAVGTGSAPTFLVSLGWYALLIPLVRVIPGLSPPGLKPFLWFLTGLYASFGVLSLLQVYSTPARIFMLLLTLATGICLIFYNRRLGRRDPRGRWIKAARVGVSLGIIMSGIAFVGEAVGATNLSRYLERAVLNSVYFAAALYGSLIILRGFLQVVLRALSTRGGTLWEMPDDLKRAFTRGLTWITVVLYLMLLLRAFELWDSLLVWGRQILAYKVEIGALEFTVGSAFAFLAVLFAATVLSRMLRFFLTASLQGRIEMQRGKTEAVSKLIHYTILTLGFFLALGASGINLNKFTVLAGALGVGIGFGLQNIVNNFVSGLILLFERPLQVGDKITVGDTSGEVKDIGIRASTITTWEGADVIIPNASLISGNVTNWTLTNNQRRSELKVGVAYGTDPLTVLRILRETALAHPNVLREPEPATLFVGFGDSSLDFCLRYWTLIEHAISVNSEIHVALCLRLAAEGIEIPFPQHDIHLKDVNPDGIKLVSD